MKSILLTAIGGDIAQGAATIIRQTFPDWRLVGVDMGDRHGGGLYVDMLAKAPRADDPAYLPWLKVLLDQEKIDFCWPFSEAEIGMLASMEPAKIGNATLITPGQHAVAVGNDKYETSLFLASLGLPGPWTEIDSSDLGPSSFPCIYKPRRTAGSKSIFICNALDEAQFFQAKFPDGIFQELLLPADREVTCAVYRIRSGETHVLPLLRNLTGGLTGWAQVIENEDITRQCQTLAEAVGLRGAMNVQLRLTEAGPRIFEINARLSSTALMRHQMGFQDTVWTLKELQEEEISVSLPKTGTIGIRTQNASIIKEQMT